MSAEEHKARAPAAGEIRVFVLTVSDSRDETSDTGGRLAADLCRAAGFVVAGTAIVRDEPQEIAGRVRELAGARAAHAILVTGGTGISGRDSTVEALASVYEKPLPGYGELFRSLSFAEVGPAAMLSRASAGTVGTAVVFAMPGSPAGVRLALTKLILPELPHIVGELGRHGRAHHHHQEDGGHARAR